MRVLASTPIGRRLYAMAMDLFWLRNPAAEPVGELELRVWEADLVDQMQEALMDMCDLRRGAA